MGTCYLKQINMLCYVMLCYYHTHYRQHHHRQSNDDADDVISHDSVTNMFVTIGLPCFSTVIIHNAIMSFQRCVWLCSFDNVNRFCKLSILF